MNKTRMGKRVASLLLSLVMMLSLLPTAAYATMADDVDTQGAIVSENGTGVSDDDNSGGDTGDQQVVGGSANGGTADDTTGAKGDADTTGAEGGNDTTGAENGTVTYVAYIGETGYETLDAAITDARDGDTVEVAEGSYTLNGSLTYTGKAITVKAANGANVIFDMSSAVTLGGAKITFENVTFNYTNADYTGLQHTDTVVYNNCTINGKMFLYANSETFNGCHFVQTSEDYNVWTYGAKKVAFNNCTFDCVGKAVNVYIEKGNASDDAKTVEVNSCKVNSDKAGKAFLNIKNSTQAYDVTLSGTNTVTGLEANGTTGSALYQVETTEVTETAGNPVTVKEKADDGTVTTVYEVKQPSANVAKVGGTEYATLEAAIAALGGSSYTLELLDESAWDAATPVYWAAGTQSGYAATLADALTAAYKANGDITIVCRPGADVGKLTHGHVADDITIYGNNAYISSGECDLEVDTFMYSRETGKQVTTGGAYLDKGITVTAYELDNLGVWGERHTDHKVTVNLTDCDTVNGITVQRVYISGTTGMNDITLTGCDFGTKATSVYSNADGAVVIDNCSFTGAQVPVNFNHKAGGTQTVTVKNSKFANCGDNGDWKQFAAPVRFVNSGSGTMTTTVDTCTFNGTVDGNGDILLGDGRVGQSSNDVKLTVANTEANVQAQQPGYYAKDGTTDESKLGTKTVAADKTLTTSVNELVSGETYVAAVGEKTFASLQAAIDAAGRKATVTLLADTRENVTISTNYLTLDLNGHTLNGGTVAGQPALTVTARVTVKDSSAEQTGTIMREDTAENSGVSSHYVIDIQDGWLFFESGSVTNNSGVVGVKGASLVRVGDDSIAKYPGLTISGGTFTQDNFIVIKVDRGTFYLKEDGTLNSKNSYAVENWKFAEIKGGTVNGTVAAWTYSGGHNSDLTISGGTVNGNVASVSYDKAEGKVAKVSITGGTVTGTLGTYTYGNGLIPIEDATKATIAVTGGTFKEDPTKYVVEDSAITPNDDGTYGVAKAYLAKVGDTSYYTMEEAFKAQTTSGEAIVLLRDYTTGSTFNSGSINRTVDLNGHTWTCTGTDANSAAFEINYSDVTLTVKNGKVFSSQLVGLIPSAMGGTIKYDNSSLVFDGVEMTTNARSGIETNGNNTNDTVTLKNSTLNVPNGFGIYFPSSGTLTIDNSKINAQTMGVQVCAGSLNITGDQTAITVSGDGIEKTGNDGAIEDGAAISIVERTGYKGLSEIKVDGGTFKANGTNAAVKAYKWENKTESDFTQAAKVFVSGGTFSSAVDKSLCADGFIPTENTDGTYGVKEGKYVAEIGSQGYESLQAAIDAAQDGQTVTLLADATADVVISKSITLDLGGKTLTNTNAGKATISVTGGTVTVKNGNVKGGTGYYNIEVTKNSGADLTLTDVTATAGNNGSSMIDNWGTLTITSGTYTGGMNTVKSEEGSVLNISGGTFTCDFGKKWSYTAVILVYGTTTITGGEFIQKTTNTSSYAQVVATGVEEGYSAITTITGGKFTNEKLSGIFRGLGKATSDNFEVSGGTFNKYVSDSYMADGYIPTKNADGTYGVKEGKFVAEVGSTGYETLDEAIAAANASTNSKTVYLRENITVDHQLVINNAKGKAITLNLQGFTLTSTYAINRAIENGSYALVNKTTLTIKNGTFAAGQARAIGALAALTLNGATVTQQLTGGHACVAFCADGKSYAIKNSTIEGAYAVCSFANNATITITGSTLTGTGNTLYHNGSNYGLKLTVKDTTITSSGSCGVYISGSTSAQSNADNQNGAGKYQQATFTGCTISGAMNGVEVKYTDLTLDGCTVSTTAEDASYKQDNNGPAGSGFAVVSTDNAMNNVTPKPEGTIIIKGTGKYTGPVGLGSLKSVKETYADFADETIKISGGTFTTEIPADYCADGFIPTQNEDGTYGVKEGKFVAEVGSKKYESLADAVAAAQDGQTVRLLADVEQNTQLSINKSITLDLNGKTIKNTVDIWGKNANAILSITNGAKVTITGNGTIDAKENDCYTINVVKGDLTIENGTFYGNVSVVQVQEGTLSVKGGTFDLHQKWEGSSKYLFNCIDDAYVDGSADVAISGGTFVGFDPNVSPEQKVDGKVPSFAAPGAGITKNEDGSFTAAAGMTAQILDRDGNSVKAYESLAEAVAAVQDGQTVRLLADAEQNSQLSINKSITLDLNGKTIKISGYTAERAQVSVKGNLTIQDSSKAQTGKICSDYTGTAGRVVSVENGGKLTIAGGTITTEGMSGPSGSAVFIASGAEVNMAGGTVKVDAKRGNVAMNVKGTTGVFIMSGGSVIAEAGDGTETNITAISGSSNSTIQISAGTVSGPQAVLAGRSATTITGGNFTGSIMVKNGSISGGTFDRALDKKACAAGYVPADNGDGTYGVAVGKFTVKVTSRTTASDSPVANVAGGGSDITYAEGITVTASAISGYTFVGWFVNEYTGTAYNTNLTCEVKPTDDCTMIAVYEPISGGKFWLTVTASEFTVNGGAVQDSYLYEQFAVGASVTVNFTGSENFLYWVNASNKVVSTDKSYTFIMGSETTLKAVYGKARQNQATVVFISHSDQIISSKAYTTNDTIQFPVPPIKMGCTFTGWSMTEAEIRAAMANNSGIIQVRALYTEPSIACKVTVVYPEGTDNQVVNAVVGKAIDVTAKDIEGKTFSYWTDNDGNILGYTKTLKLAPSGDMTVKAVYGENAEVKPVISMTAIDASAGNGYYVISVTATRAVPEGYELVKQGILYSLDSRCAGDAGKDYLKLTADGTVPEGVYEYSGTDQALNGVTRFNGKVGAADTTLYGRGYMILKNSAGEVLYVYADTILSGSYNSLNK